jgi:hypothetical protein
VSVQLADLRLSEREREGFADCGSSRAPPGKSCWRLRRHRQLHLFLTENTCGGVRGYAPGPSDPASCDPWLTQRPLAQARCLHADQVIPFEGLQTRRWRETDSNFQFPALSSLDTICLRQRVLLAERPWGSIQSTTIPPSARLESKNPVEFAPGLYDVRDPCCISRRTFGLADETIESIP